MKSVLRIALLFITLIIIAGCENNEMKRIASISSSRNAAVLWCDKDVENFASFNSSSQALTSAGIIKKLKLWQCQSVVTNDTLYSLGWTNNQTSSLSIFKNIISTGDSCMGSKLDSLYKNVVFAGTYNNQLIVLWNQGPDLNIGQLHTNSARINQLGTVKGLANWQQQCIIKDSSLYCLGHLSDNSAELILFRNSLKTGKNISQIKLDYQMDDIVIAGKYDDQIILVWWNKGIACFGTLNTTYGTIYSSGTIGDLSSWEQQSIVIDNSLYTIGYTNNYQTQTILIRSDIATGSLLSKTVIPTNKTNPVFSKNK